MTAPSPSSEELEEAIEMCGITGWVSYDRDLTTQRHTLQAMTDTMNKRGPDDEGLWVDTHAGLGHRRLSIIDIPGGHQPITATRPDGSSLTIVYSGETYNFPELRNALRSAGHDFVTASDTEVVLHQHLEVASPVRAVEALNGMFAYALWDTRSEELTLVRDRLGIKPLYYYETDDGVLFGSEPKAILANELSSRHVDDDGLRRLFGFVADPSNAVFQGMKEVPPGHIVRVTRRGLRQEKYWGLDDHEHTDDIPTTVRTVRELLDDTAARQLVADVPLCTLLSGGLDSSALTALAAQKLTEQNKGAVRSFAVDFVGYADNFVADDVRGTPDSQFVKDVAEHVHADHHDIVLSNDDLLKPANREAVLRARDLPGIGDMDTSLFLLFQAVREQSTVALSGESADEVFGGYADFHNPDVVAADTFPWLAGAMMKGRQTPFAPDVAARLDLDAYVEAQYRRALAEVPRRASDAHRDDAAHEIRMREICYLYLTRFLPILLDRKDRMSMAVGLEVRVPFCDHRLVQYVFGTPWAHKTFDGREKSLLRAATQDLLPDSVVKRVKSPYPSTQDPQYAKALQQELGSVLDDPNAPVAALFDRKAMSDMAAHAGDDQVQRHTAEQIVGVNSWMKEYSISL